MKILILSLLVTFAVLSVDKNSVYAGVKDISANTSPYESFYLWKDFLEISPSPLNPMDAEDLARYIIFDLPELIRQLKLAPGSSDKSTVIKFLNDSVHRLVELPVDIGYPYGLSEYDKMRMESTFVAERIASELGSNSDFKLKREVSLYTLLLQFANSSNQNLDSFWLVLSSWLGAQNDLHMKIALEQATLNHLKQGNLNHNLILASIQQKQYEPTVSFWHKVDIEYISLVGEKGLVTFALADFFSFVKELSSQSLNKLQRAIDIVDGRQFPDRGYNDLFDLIFYREFMKLRHVDNPDFLRPLIGKANSAIDLLETRLASRNFGIKQCSGVFTVF